MKLKINYTLGILCTRDSNQGPLRYLKHVPEEHVFRHSEGKVIFPIEANQCERSYIIGVETLVV